MQNLNLDNLTDEQIEMLEGQLATRKENTRLARERERNAYESLVDDTVRNRCIAAINFQQTMLEFKEQSLNDVTALYSSLLEYSNRHKSDSKGNFTLDTKDKLFRIIYRNAILMDFDERAAQGKSHVLSFVNKRYDGDEETRDLILALLDESAGKLNARDVNRLIKMEARFNDENWNQGIALLKESYKEVDTKSYIRFYKKDSQGQYKQISLDFASLVVPESDIAQTEEPAAE